MQVACELQAIQNWVILIFCRLLVTSRIRWLVLPMSHIFLEEKTINCCWELVVGNGLMCLSIT